MTPRSVDRLEVEVMFGGFDPFAADDLAGATDRAFDDDATGVIRERLSDGSWGREWRVTVDRHRLFEERRVLEVAA